MCLPEKRNEERVFLTEDRKCGGIWIRQAKKTASALMRPHRPDPVPHAKSRRLARGDAFLAQGARAALFKVTRTSLLTAGEASPFFHCRGAHGIHTGMTVRAAPRQAYLPGSRRVPNAPAAKPGKSVWEQSTGDAPAVQGYKAREKPE